MQTYETNLPLRYYMPLSAVDPKILRPSKTISHCPYKGESRYYYIKVDGKLIEDVFKYYTTSTLGSARIAGIDCPYNEKVDIEADEEEMTIPKTYFA